MTTRRLLDQFQLPNIGYAGCAVTVYVADANGLPTVTKATLYDSLTGAGTLFNPQTFTSEGALSQPTYFDVPVVPIVTGAHVTSQTLGVILPPGGARGDWATATLYLPGDIVVDSAAGTNTKDFYAVVNLHQSGVWATDSANAAKLKLILDVSALSIAPDATTAAKGKAQLATIAVTKAGSDAAEIVTADDLAAFWQQGADIASAAVLVKPADASLGGVHRITGNVAINSFWAGSVDGEEIEFRFVSAPNLTIAGNLLPPGGAFQTVAGDMIRWRWDASAVKWRAYSGLRADGRALVATTVTIPSKEINSYYQVYTANANLTATVPIDNTPPLTAETAQAMVQAAVTTTATQKVQVRASGVMASAASIRGVVCLFVGGVCVATEVSNTFAAENKTPFSFVYEAVIGSATSTNVEIRAGTSDGSSVRFNGDLAAALFAGTMGVFLSVKVLEP